ncbi:MAG: glycosyltransferase [Bacteroidota bacterium]|nr:glycosyltransferase [Bacteroidota bacterium]
MSFAGKYLKRHSIYHPQINESPANDLQIIVVIPCYNEPDILKTLNCLIACEMPPTPVEVLVVINSGEGDKEEIIVQNKKTENEIKAWSDFKANEKIKTFVIHKNNLSRKHAGAGLARKIGMDEAIHRFNKINKPNGIIVSFDADSLCSPNYLSEIYQQFRKRPKATACSIYFEHPVLGKEFSPEIYRAVTRYELYMRFYNQALRYTGYPYSFHTVGSCFAVRASVYAAQGGMNRKQAGEDFYFLQKVIPLGGFFEINETCVFPSPRPSDRVCFGTGSMVNSLVKSDIDFKTYPVKIFSDLLHFFSDIKQLYAQSDNAAGRYILQQSNILQEFLLNNFFIENIAEINANSADRKNFVKRFFRWFNAFRILKYANYACENEYQKESLIEVANQLGRETGILKKENSEAEVLLSFYRRFEKENQNET